MIESVFQNFCLLGQQVAKIRQTLTHEEMSAKKRVDLHKELEGVQKSLKQLETLALSTRAQGETQLAAIRKLNDEIISTYRQIEERFEEHEISLISKEALEIGTHLEKGKMEQLAAKVERLSGNIYFLFEHRRPSLKNRKILQLVLKVLDHVKQALSKGRAVVEQIRFVYQLRILLEEALAKTGEIDLEEVELSLELNEIAELLFRQKVQEGRLRLSLIQKRLSYAQRTRINRATNNEELACILQEIADGDPCLAEQKNTICPFILQA